MDLIFEKKPYKMVDGKIVFISNGPNTLLFQQGAGIVLDGVYMGTDPSCLAHIPRMDIDKVFVSTNPNDVSRYTGLNSIGIIEVYTRSAMRLKNERFGTGPAAEADIDPDAFPGPDYSILPKKGPKDLRSVLYWMPSVRTDENGKALITFYNGDIPGKVIISLNGITDEGTPVSATLTYNISR